MNDRRTLILARRIQLLKNQPSSLTSLLPNSRWTIQSIPMILFRILEKPTIQSLEKQHRIPLKTEPYILLKTDPLLWKPTCRIQSNRSLIHCLKNQPSLSLENHESPIPQQFVAAWKPSYPIIVCEKTEIQRCTYAHKAMMVRKRRWAAVFTTCGEAVPQNSDPERAEKHSSWPT